MLSIATRLMVDAAVDSLEMLWISSTILAQHFLLIYRTQELKMQLFVQQQNHLLIHQIRPTMNTTHRHQDHKA